MNEKVNDHSATTAVETAAAVGKTAGSKGSSRRAFLGHLGGAAAAGVAVGALGVGASAPAALAEVGPATARAQKDFNIKVTAATNERNVAQPPHTTNGDINLYSDKSGTYTKGLLQDTYGVVNPFAYQSFIKAIKSGSPTDWDNIVIGGTRTENGPQGAYAFPLEGTDSGQFGNAASPANQQLLVVVPPAPAIASTVAGAELVEHYWGALLRDVAFTDYPTNATAIAAAAELNTIPGYQGPRDSNGQVTTNNIFRGVFQNELIGPYVSQFWITPTNFGQQAIPQLYTTYVPDVDYMTDLATWFDAQNGINSGLANQNDSVLRYLHNGRGLAAFTHVDGLAQEYLNALLVMNTLGVPLNPGNPYVGNRTQNGFCTFGGPDMQAQVAGIGAKALDAVWYQKWLVHLRNRPEAGGGIVHLIQTGQGNTIDATMNSNVLNSQALAQTFSKYGTYLLPQAFPEGSPYHPSYPTGHGTVGGACITLLKYFFDGSFVIPHPMVPSSDGTELFPYTGSDAGQITVAGELNKLASNVSFAHGIHAGIHWRSDTYNSMILGETYAISVLQDRAQTYNEKFTISFTKLDGTTCTITNQ